MATETYTKVYDDLLANAAKPRKVEGAERYTFSLNDTSYEIDLTEESADKLSKALEPFIAAGRVAQPEQTVLSAVKATRTRTRTRTRSAGSSGQPSSLAAEVRLWAQGKKMNVQDKGKLAPAVWDAWKLAHPHRAAEAPQPAAQAAAS